MKKNEYLYEISDSFLAEIARETVQIFWLLGLNVVSYENGKKTVVMSSTPLNGKIIGVGHNKSLLLETETQKIEMSFHGEENCAFEVERENQKITIHTSILSYTSYDCFSIEQEDKKSSKKVALFSNLQNLKLCAKENEVEQDFSYGRLTTKYQIKDNAFEKSIAIERKKVEEDKKYQLNISKEKDLESSSIKVLANSSDYKKYSEELFQTNEVQKLYTNVLTTLEQNFSNITSIMKNYDMPLIQPKNRSLIYSLYTSLNQKIYEYRNPYRIEELLEKLENEKEKVYKKEMSHENKTI